MADYWTENNITKPQAFVVCAACKYDDVIILGARHWDERMRQQYEMMEDSNRWLKYGTSAPHANEFDQGFINQFGEFLTRREAMIAAKEKGQLVDIQKGCGGNEDVLFSEGLY